MTVMFHIETFSFFFAILLKNWDKIKYSYGEEDTELDFDGCDDEEDDGDDNGQGGLKLYDGLGSGGGGAFIMC
jgi:hypothetical protein